MSPPDGCVLVPEGCVSFPEECVLVPEGCVLLPEGCVLLPKGCVSLPEECVLLPERCPPQCCDLTAADGRMCVLKGSRTEIKVKCSFSLSSVGCTISAALSVFKLF